LEVPLSAMPVSVDSLLLTLTLAPHLLAWLSEASREHSPPLMDAVSLDLLNRPSPSKIALHHMSLPQLPQPLNADGLLMFLSQEMPLQLTCALPLLWLFLTLIPLHQPLPHVNTLVSSPEPSPPATLVEMLEVHLKQLPSEIPLLQMLLPLPNACSPPTD